MAIEIKRIAGRVLAIVAIVGLLTLQGCIHPHRRFHHAPPGHVKHHNKHHYKHNNKHGNKHHNKHGNKHRKKVAAPRPHRRR